MPAASSQSDYLQSLNPVNQIPEFELDDEQILGNDIPTFDNLDADAANFLQEFPFDRDPQLSAGTDLSQDVPGNIGPRQYRRSRLQNRIDNVFATSANDNDDPFRIGLKLGLDIQANSAIGSASLIADELNTLTQPTVRSLVRSTVRALAKPHIRTARRQRLRRRVRRIIRDQVVSGVTSALNYDFDAELTALDATNDRSSAPLEENTTVASASLSTLIAESPPDSYASGEILAENLEPEQSARIRSLGFSVEHDASSGIARLRIPPDMSHIEAAKLLQRALPDNHLHLNRVYRLYAPAAPRQDDDTGKPHSDNTRCLRDRCYGRQAIQWNEDLKKCARALKIGIIDTHVELQHKSLAGQSILQKTFTPEGRPISNSGHGTSVLAILAGRTDSETPGLVSDANFHVASVFFIGDDNTTQTDTVTLMKALHWMDQSGVRIVNMSFSGPNDALLESKFEQLRNEAGMVFAAAAGNEGLAAGASYPAAYPHVIAVTAIDKKLRVYPSANRGNYIDIAAPGVHIWTALPNSKAGYLSGTSFATPYVTAMLAIQRPETLLLPKSDLLNVMKTVPLESDRNRITYGRGLLQAPGFCPGVPEMAKGRHTPPPKISLK
ncbi:MAG: S8 family serine peptidase [Hyphomicrobiales bacterium]|nr:S8 family serine peptidase [Hyphomicrobiales bacterium]